MILKHLASFNVAVARLLRKDASLTPAVVSFCAKFTAAPEGNPPPSMHLHRVDDARSRNVWSARGDLDLRVILRKRGPAWYVAHIEHHDPTYEWARTHEIQLPKTKAATGDELDGLDFLGVVDTSANGGNGATVASRQVDDESRIFDPFDDESLDQLGVPHVMVPMLRRLRTIEEFIDSAYASLPEGLGDRLFAALAGDFGTVAEAIEGEPDDHSATAVSQSPDVREAIAVLAEHPEATWAALPDAQQQAIAMGDFKGPVLITGPAGSGKTVVALHRARYLASKGHRVFVTTFTRALRSFLWQSLRTLCSEAELDLIEVRTVDYMAMKLSGYDDSLFDDDFLKHEDFQRLCDEATRRLHKREAEHDFDAIVVDETQDLDPRRLAFIQTLSRKCRKRLMLLGDMEQRIYSIPCDLEDLGFDFGDRVFRLNTVYRSTQEIMELGRSILASGDDAREGRLPFAATAYASGPKPEFFSFSTDEDEVLWALTQVLLLVQEGTQPPQIGVLTHTRRRRDTLRVAFDAVGLGRKCGLHVMTMHAAKGLEFGTTLLLDVSEDRLPNHWAGEHEKERGTYADWLERQRHLLHVAATRAADRVFVGWVGQPSPFLVKALEAVTPTFGMREGPDGRLQMDVSRLTHDPAGLKHKAQDGPLGGKELAESLHDHVHSLLLKER